MFKIFKHSIFVFFVIYISTSCNSEQHKKLTLAESIVFGGLVGAAEVTFPGQILQYIMNMRMQHKPFRFQDCYNGFTVHAAGQMPIVALQKVVQVEGSECIKNNQQAALSSLQKAGVSFAAGCAGSLIDTPSNLVQLQQQSSLHKNSTLQVLRKLGKKSFAGFFANSMLKEGPFALGYQFLAPSVTQSIQPYIDNKNVATTLAGVMAGVLIAIWTQPGAVIRNYMQMEALTSLSPQKARSVMQSIFAKEGYRGFFVGLKQRGARVAIAIPIYTVYGQAIESCMQK